MIEVVIFFKKKNESIITGARIGDDGVIRVCFGLLFLETMFSALMFLNEIKHFSTLALYMQLLKVYDKQIFG